MSFATDPSGPGVPPACAAAPRRVPQHRVLDPHAHHLVAYHGVAVAVLAVELDCPVDRRLAREAPAADRDPLVHERGERDPPAVADVAETVRVGNAYVGEIH